MSLGLLPFGRAIGESIGSLPQKWLLMPFGIQLGFVTTWSEPAVRILTKQVEEASTGSIRHSLVRWTGCLAVAVGAQKWLSSPTVKLGAQRGSKAEFRRVT